MRTPSHTEHAVSPVVGVMLMLAVTVMIAAVVSTYAGGFSGGADKSPQSSIRVIPNINEHRIYFDHSGGDPFTLNSIEVVLRARDNKTSLSVLDIGGKVIKFDEVGSTSIGDKTIQAGDTFFIEGIGSDTGMKFGSMILINNTKISWLVIDKETSKTIALGSFYL
ncbi:MAG: type IV pilin N-terminal domain-containing protein [Methanoregula sp.]|nr:type IV pilin N-terminal domain-containing protein [Methanoregula sp.]